MSTTAVEPLGSFIFKCYQFFFILGVAGKQFEPGPFFDSRLRYSSGKPKEIRT